LQAALSASDTYDGDGSQIDYATISREVKAGTRTKVRSERREIQVHWNHEVKYAFSEAVITPRVPLRVANCQHDQPHVGACS
jgi:hypothetical protein